MAKKTQKKMGRPQIEIDEAQFRKLCNIMCTAEEIAGFFDCSVDTIERWTKRTFGETFAVVYKRLSSAGKISLRRYQFEIAKKNAGMAIFLGKNYLGQRDSFEMASEGEVVDDGFIKALSESAIGDWSDDEEESDSL